MNIYESIASRTNGDIYVGVVGPVRTGKSTFISRFMDKLVLPNIKDYNDKRRAEDELPQSGSGKLIMTMQPRFVPNEAVEISLEGNAKARVRLIDCVGYLIDEAVGHSDGENPRLVKTPWSDEAIPFSRAAEIGTHKVIADHSTIGIVVTTDGTIGDIPRKNYVEAEERVINELKELNKPFIVVLNSATPLSEETYKLRVAMEEMYGVPVLIEDVDNMTEQDFNKVLEKVLFEFPVNKINISLPEWMTSLSSDNEIIVNILNEVSSLKLSKMIDYTKAFDLFKDSDEISSPVVENINLALGEVNYHIGASKELLYKTLSNICGINILNDFDLISYMTEASIAKAEYTKLQEALENVNDTGYGVVIPSVNDLELSKPEVVKRSGNSGVKLKAKASSLHILKVDVETEVTPAVSGIGITEGMLTSGEVDEETQKTIWNTNMFGKTLSELAHDGIVNKVQAFPEEAQIKMRKTLSKITNEGRGGIICILL
ncbi:MAG: stage IV sporulation protein A [Clostridia bacterium]|nr:stage IV sporulation protein A [Clostridia bacterium]